MRSPASSDHASQRNAAALVILVLFCLLSSARLFRNSPGLTHLKPDDIAQRSDHRFSKLRSELPQHGVVGYIGEPGDSAIPDYYLAQYALAPLILDHSTDHPFVIGNFPTSQPAVPKDLRVLKDFGNGVLLLANEEAR